MAAHCFRPNTISKSLKPSLCLLLATHLHDTGGFVLCSVSEHQMARMIRPLRHCPPLHHHLVFRSIFTHIPSPPSPFTAVAAEHYFFFSTAATSQQSHRHRPRGLRMPNAPSPSELQDTELSDSDSDARKSRNQKKREARRAVRWGMEIASFSTPQIKCILRVASLEQEVLEALMLVKRLGPDIREGKRRQYNYIGKLLREAEPELMDALIQATKVGDHKMLQSLAASHVQVFEDEDDDDELGELEAGDEDENSECINIASRWFDGLISKDTEVTKEVYSVDSIDFDRQELRRLVRRVQTAQEHLLSVTEENRPEADSAVRSANKPLTRFLLALAKQLPKNEIRYDQQREKEK